MSGAHDDADARAIARAVVSSSLVKAAVHGRDPNWGRIAARGRQRAPPVGAGSSSRPAFEPTKAEVRAGSPATLDPALLRIAIAGHAVFDGAAGRPARLRPRRRSAMTMDRSEVVIRASSLDLGHGTGEAFGCDLTEAYVIENSEYTT